MADSWHDMANELTRERTRQESDDLNNEVAGRETGRIKRFVSPEHIGSEATKTDDDVEFQLFSDMVLQAEISRQERLQALSERYERINHAFDKAIAKSAKELEEARIHRDEVYENGTKLSGDRRAFLDKDTDQFKYANGERISAEDEIEATANYKSSDSSASTLKSADDLHFKKTLKIQGLGDKKKAFQSRFDDLENSDMSLDELEDAFDDIEADPDLTDSFEDSPVAATNTRSTSYAKSAAPDGNSESNLATAFANAVDHEQVSTEPVHDIEHGKPSPQSSPGMALG